MSVREAKDLDCCENCTSVQHGQKVCAIAAVAQGVEAVPMWLKTCANYANVQDEFGRTALHVVASNGNFEALEWLIKRGGANIDKRDKISGYTPLHRSIYFGQIHIAQCLIKFGADASLRDNEGIMAFELCNLDGLSRQKINIKSDPTELLVWGTNDNFTLGNLNQQERTIPDQVELFRKNGAQIMKAVISTYHSVFLSQVGEIFVCGSGRNGSLGNGYDKVVHQPEQLHIKSASTCVAVAASNHHTLFLMENGRVFSCGSNEYGISGQKESVSKSLVPRPVDFHGNVNIEGILAARYHSIFYTPYKLYTCGVNRGQIGHSAEKGPSIYEPKLVSQMSWDPEGDTKFTHFATSTCATVARTSSGIIYVFHKFESIKINAKQFDVVKLQVYGGGFAEARADRAGGPALVHHEHLVVLLLTSTGRIIVWRAQTNSTGSTGVFSRVVFNSGRVLDIANIHLNQSNLLMLTRVGEAYKSVWNPLNVPTYIPLWQSQKPKGGEQSANDFQISTGTKRAQKGKDASSGVSMLEHVKIQKIKTIYAGLDITSDEFGRNFAVIQSSAKSELTTLPVILRSRFHLDLQKFLDGTTEEDTLHDVILKVGKRRFPAHMYVISSGCPKLYSMIVSQVKQNRNNQMELPVVEIPNVHGQVFEQILQFIYSHSCDLLTEGKTVIAFDLSDIIKSATDAARSLELENMCKALKKFMIVEDVVRLKSPDVRFEPHPRRFIRKVNEDLADITLQSQDGQLFKAHRCVLISRSEYFYSMLFANVWLERCSRDKPIQMTFSSVCLEVLLEFIYEDTISNLPNHDFDALAEILAMSDNLFVERLRTLVEAVLAEMLSLKNVASMLYLADRCNAVELKKTCMQFISMNLPWMLETRVLDSLPVELVKGVSTYYCQIHPNLTPRTIKSPEVPALSELKTAMQNISQELFKEIEAAHEDEEVKKPQGKPKPKARIRSRMSENDHDLLTAGMKPQSLVGGAELKTAEPQKNDRVVQPFRSLFPNPKQTMKMLDKAESKETKRGEKGLKSKEFPRLGTATMQSTAQPKPLQSQSQKETPQGNPSAKKKTKWTTVDFNNMKKKPLSNVATPSPVLPPSRDPNNPWKIENTQKVEFKEILQDEVEKKQNLEKATTKSLVMMQIEDRAMNELELRYHSKDVEDGVEIVSVERNASTNFAPPTWVQHHSRKNKNAQSPKLSSKKQ